MSSFNSSSTNSSSGSSSSTNNSQNTDSQATQNTKEANTSQQASSATNPPIQEVASQVAEQKVEKPEKEGLVKEVVKLLRSMMIPLSILLVATLGILYLVAEKGRQVLAAVLRRKLPKYGISPSATDKLTKGWTPSIFQLKYTPNYLRWGFAAIRLELQGEFDGKVATEVLKNMLMYEESTRFYEATLPSVLALPDVAKEIQRSLGKRSSHKTT